MSLKSNNVTAPGEIHYHGNVKCYSKSCASNAIGSVEAIVRDPMLVQSPTKTNWRSQTYPIATEKYEKALGKEFGPDSQGFGEENL